MIDPALLKGKIAALQPSFLLMSEMTGKPSTASVMGFYAEYFVTHHIAIDDANRAVESIMAGWAKGWWPDPEQIGARAIEIVRREYAAQQGGNRGAEIEEWMAQAGAAKWEHRLTMANEWRTHNPTAFQAVLGTVNTYCRGADHLAWLQDSEVYRQSFRHGAIVQACNNQAGREEQIAAKKEAIARHERAMQFGSTGVV